MGAAGFAVCYIRRNTTEETFRVQAEEGAKEAGKEVYGVGIEKGDGTISGSMKESRNPNENFAAAQQRFLP